MIAERKRKKNVLVYMDREAIGIDENSTDYLVRTLKKNSDFNVLAHTSEDPTISMFYDVVLCRFDPPKSEKSMQRESFLKELDKFQDSVKFINPPKTILKYSNKKSQFNALKELGLMPKTVISRDYNELADFMQDRRFVVKPFNGYGGIGVERYDGKLSRMSLESLAEELTNSGTQEILAQEYLDGVTKYGDKRINVINGYPASAVLRVAKKGEFRCNGKQGGRGIKTDITPRDYRVIERLQPFLYENGLVWAGVDLIYNSDNPNDDKAYVTEVNITSAGWLVEGDRLNKNTAGVDSLINALKQFN